MQQRRPTRDPQAQPGALGPRRRARRVGGLAVLLCAAPCGCGDVPPPPPEAPTARHAIAPPAESAAAPRFVFRTLDGTAVSSEALHGRLTVVGLVTSYDSPSQSQAVILRALHKDHAPRVNVLLVVLEGEEARPMVEAFAAALAAPFPIALGDADAIAGRAPFPGLHQVPSLVVLDASGRERWRHVGQVSEQDIDGVLRGLEPHGAAGAGR
jgi:hypothetical protein